MDYFEFDGASDSSDSSTLLLTRVPLAGSDLRSLHVWPSLTDHAEELAGIVSMDYFRRWSDFEISFTFSDIAKCWAHNHDEYNAVDIPFKDTG
jgi:hypothetical protein